MCDRKETPFDYQKKGNRKLDRERERGEKEACSTHHPTAKPPRLVGNVKVGFSFPLSWSSAAGEDIYY